MGVIPFHSAFAGLSLRDAGSQFQLGRRNAQWEEYGTHHWSETLLRGGTLQAQCSNHEITTIRIPWAALGDWLTLLLRLFTAAPDFR